jgi:metal-responsive CopG/Arc/MetJ family transcriptional regulator
MMPRAKIGSRIAVNIGPKLLNAVDSWAAEVGLNRSEAIRSLLVAALWIDHEVRSVPAADEN